MLHSRVESSLDHPSELARAEQFLYEREGARTPGASLFKRIDSVPNLVPCDAIAVGPASSRRPAADHTEAEPASSSRK
jgi:hypothetical protein